MEFDATQLFLVKTLRCKLSGSRARGNWREDSDWDYWIPERNVKKLIKWLDAQGVHHKDSSLPGNHWYSPFIGSITWWVKGVQVEVSILFPKKHPYHSFLGE